MNYINKLHACTCSIHFTCCLTFCQPIVMQKIIDLCAHECFLCIINSKYEIIKNMGVHQVSEGGGSSTK